VGSINAALSVTAFVCGLPWGAVGVAAVYATTGLLIRLPILLWFAGRRGFVRTRDFYAVTLVFAVPSLCALAALRLLREMVSFHPLSGVITGAVLVAGVNLLVLCSFSTGRRWLQKLAQAAKALRASPSPQPGEAAVK
jgi:PST family polysaccharide transporter